MPETTASAGSPLPESLRARADVSFNSDFRDVRLHADVPELTHVVQQRNGLSSADLAGPGDRYEQEADAAGAAFLRNAT